MVIAATSQQSFSSWWTEKFLLHLIIASLVKLFHCLVPISHRWIALVDELFTDWFFTFYSLASLIQIFLGSIVIKKHFSGKSLGNWLCSEVIWRWSLHDMTFLRCIASSQLHMLDLEVFLANWSLIKRVDSETTSLILIWLCLYKLNLISSSFLASSQRWQLIWPLSLIGIAHSSELIDSFYHLFGWLQMADFVDPSSTCRDSTNWDCSGPL